MNAVIVLGLNLPGIDIIKCFHELKIEVKGFDFRDNAPGLLLSNKKVSICPNPETEEESFLAFLSAIGDEYSIKPVIFVTSDSFVLPIQRNKQKLRDIFLFNESISHVIEDLLSKEGMYQRAIKHNVPVPFTRTILFSAEDNLEIEDLNYPLIIKPHFAPDWRIEPLKSLVEQKKVVYIKDCEALAKWIDIFRKYSCDIVVQEVIQGQDSNLLYFVSYMTREGVCSASFCGQKERITPIHFGSASFMRVVDSEPIKKMCVDFLKESNYWGPSGVEMKLDDRDGNYKLVEVNARFGLWDVMGKYLGENVFLAAYEDLTQSTIKDKKRSGVNKKTKWVALTRDIPAYFEYKNEKLLTLWSWLKSIAPYQIHYADIDISEIKLMKRYYFDKIIKKLKRHV